MRQRRTYAYRVDEGDVMARSLLEARAFQVPFIHGYTIDMTFVSAGAFNTNGDQMSGTIEIQANPQSPTTAFNMNTDPWLALANFRGNIGLLSRYVELEGGTTQEALHMNFNWSTGYIPCGFEVPGLWTVGQHSTVGSLGSRMVAVIGLDFDWLTRSSLEIAALYTTYGIDAVDAQEREATAAGEIRFGQTLAGEHDQPDLIS